MDENNIAIWSPSAERVSNSNFTRYFSFLRTHFKKDFNNYDELYNWSILQIEEFWKSLWEYSRIIHAKSYETVLGKRIMPGAQWFGGSKLNFAENLLRYNDDRDAIISIRENHPTIRLTYKELYNLVAKCAAGLKKLGVKKRMIGLQDS